MKYYLTDGTDVFDEAEMTADEAYQANSDCKVRTAGNIYWTTVCPERSMIVELGKRRRQSLL